MPAENPIFHLVSIQGTVYIPGPGRVKREAADVTGRARRGQDELWRSTALDVQRPLGF